MEKINGIIYVYSFGGCGTRMFYEWLKLRYSGINNQVNVHHGKPPKKLNKNDRVIYLAIP